MNKEKKVAIPSVDDLLKELKEQPLFIDAVEVAEEKEAFIASVENLIKAYHSKILEPLKKYSEKENE